MKKPRILIVQPDFNPPGGSASVAAFGVQALRDDYEIELMSWEPINFAEIDRFYGSRLTETRFVTYGFAALLRRLVSLDPDPYSLQRVGFLVRRTRKMRAQYDFVASFCDEMDLGGVGLQYIHYPWLERLYQECNGHSPRWTKLRVRYRPFQLISNYSFERMKQNVTLVNSDWTGKRTRNRYGIPTRTVYPPVTGDFLPVPWDGRENGFVCIGRISGEKRLQNNIQIVQGLRARGHAVHLHIVGTHGPAHTESYYRLISGLVEQHSDWVSLHENISRVALHEIVAAHRYGIHGKPDEHFGLAPAEMVRGGCIVFVPNDGGQVEIVGHDERLVYGSIDDAVEKISSVLENDRLQRELQVKLNARAELFSAERFMKEIREIFAGLIHTNGKC
jgi:glycosyltransferase involved in cell wall biosynthesis